MSTNRVEGAAKTVGGKIEAGVGKLIGDTKMQVDGKAKQVEGKLQNAVGGAEDALDDAREDARNP